MRSDNGPTAIIGLLMAFTMVRASPTPEGDQDQRPLKVKEMLSYMNETADPCEDFYNFVCGNWPNVHPATEVEFQTNIFHLAQLEMTHKVVQTLAERKTDDTQFERLVKDYYEACLDQPTLDVYPEKLKEIIGEFGEMPVLEGDSWSEDNFDWLKTVAEIKRKYDYSIIVGFVILPDLDDITVSTIRVRHPFFKSLSLKLDEVQRNKYREKISKHLKKYLGLPEIMAQQTAVEILDFEATLVKGTKADPSAVTETVYTTTAALLRRKYFPDLNLQKLLQIALGSVPRGYIYEVHPEYHEHLITVMKTTPKRIVANYVFYQLISRFLPPAFERGTKEEECQRTTYWYFANIVDNMMYRKHQADWLSAEQSIVNMFHNIQNFFEGALSSETYYPWISTRTRKRAVDKLRDMTIKINSYEDVNFEQEYGSLKMDKHDYVANMKMIYQLQANQTRAKLNEKVKPYYDPVTGTFSPEYILTENLIHMPLALMQPWYFYSSLYPQAVNFGKLGTLLAHEIVHGFDSLGGKRDKYGNEKNWWDSRSTHNFNMKMDCFRKQITNFTYAGLSFVPLQYQAENIADNSGTRLAFEAYMAWYDKASLAQVQEDLEMFKGLSYNHQQLFFIVCTQVWCTDTHQDRMKNIALNDNHLPVRFRANNPLLNYKKFAEAFNCPKGSPMNPEEKCEMY